MLIGILVLASGCITIEENYTFKKDGSGTMEYVVDLSEMADMMKGLPSSGEEKGKDDGVKRMDMSDDLGKLRKLPGIKKVGLEKEKDGYVQRLSFGFADIASLNGALNVLMPDSSGKQLEFFRWEGNTLVRTNNNHAAEMSANMGNDPADSTDMSGILKSMHYKYRFAFAQDVTDLRIAEGMNKDTTTTRSFKLSTDWSVIGKDPKALDLRITLNK